ncbi:MAG: chorismate synthase, partial [Clostridia bacterium]
MYKGKALNLQIIGESHSESIGMILSGVPKDININLQELQNFVDRRKSNSSKYSTKRKEKDKIILQSGIQNNATETFCTNGEDIKFCIKNECQNSTDYNNLKNIPRPSHADYPAYIKYNGQSLVGGGKFSGRMTAPICIAGGIAKQILAQKNIFVGAYVSEIGNILSCSYKQKKITYDDIKKAQQNSLHLINSKSALDILNKIEVAQKEGDSLGGVVEAIAFNVPVGLGDNLFDGLESYISNAIFAIPAVKGVEFGIGFDIAKLCGSSANDCYTLKNDCKNSATVCKIGATVKTSATDSETSVTDSKMSVIHSETSVTDSKVSVMHGETSAVNATNVKDITSKITCTSNNNGGIVGGMSNGMPLCVRVAIKPTPSIFKQQDSVDLQTLQNVKLNIEGRHDTCIVPRAVVCV